jgi:hypothetical protein
MPWDIPAAMIIDQAERFVSPAFVRKANPTKAGMADRQGEA